MYYASLPDFGEELRKYRKRWKLSRKALASILEISWRTVELYEQGRSVPPFKKYAAILGKLRKPPPKQ
jgi:predicted transcriptional regulator